MVITFKNNIDYIINFAILFINKNAKYLIILVFTLLTTKTINS